MDWIVGDVHGMLRPLETLVRAVRTRDPDARLTFTGDYADRGPDTAGVVDFLLTLDDATFVRGNHDDVMDLLCNGRAYATGPAGLLVGSAGPSDPATDAAVVEAYGLFLDEGLRQTLASYGITPPPPVPTGDVRASAARVREATAKIPETHRRFFRDLPPVVEGDGWFVVHATWPCDYLDDPGRMNATLARDLDLRHEALWGRFNANQIRSVKVWQRTGYFGHTPTDNYLRHDDLIDTPGRIIRGEKAVLVDTAAFSPSGRLTAQCHQTGEIIQVAHGGTLL